MPANHQRKLIPVKSDKGRTVIDLDADIMFMDGSIAGLGDWDFLCPHCGRLLAKSIALDAVKNVVIQCGRCHKLSEFPERWPTGS